MSHQGRDKGAKRVLSKQWPSDGPSREEMRRVNMSDPGKMGAKIKAVAEERGFYCMPADQHWSPICGEIQSPEVEAMLRAAWEESGRPAELKI